MDNALGFTIDISQVVAGLKKLGDAIPGAKITSALAIGYEVLRLSQEEVPHDKGSLQNSGTVEEVEDYVVVGYHTPYAARLHEHPEYRFQAGRKGKYLEDPILRNQSALGISFGETFRGQLDG